MLVTPPDGYLAWTWYWQGQVAVTDDLLVLPNGQRRWIPEIHPSWVFSGQRCHRHPATYATETLWDAPYLDWRPIPGGFELAEPGQPPVQVFPPSLDDLRLTYWLRRGYTLEEQVGKQILVHTPSGAYRQVQGSQCSCQAPQCIHRALARYYLRHRAALLTLGLAKQTP